jgi:hypothetical protein
VFLFLTLNWNESCCLSYKEGKLQFTARNYIMLRVCVCVCHKLLAAAAAVVAAGAAGGRGGGGDVIQAGLVLQQGYIPGGHHTN